MELLTNIRSLPIVQKIWELRRRVFIVVITWVVFLLAGWGLSDHLMDFVERPLNGVTKLYFDTLTAPFITHFKVSAYAAVFFTIPMAFLQLWLFIRKEIGLKVKSFILPFLLLSYPLFAGGAIFCYLVPFPLAVDFLVNFDPAIKPSLRVDDFLSFALRLLIVFGLIFEMPLVSLLLTRIGILTPGFLTRNRSYAIVVLFMVAAVLAPPDVLSMIMLAVPLLALYEVSIIVCRLAQPRRPKDPAGP